MAKKKKNKGKWIFLIIILIIIGAFVSERMYKAKQPKGIRVPFLALLN